VGCRGFPFLVPLCDVGRNGHSATRYCICCDIDGSVHQELEFLGFCQGGVYAAPSYLLSYRSMEQTEEEAVKPSAGRLINFDRLDWRKVENVVHRGSLFCR
jgi:hypothetical protein